MRPIPEIRTDISVERLRHLTASRALHIELAGAVAEAKAGKTPVAERNKRIVADMTGWGHHKGRRMEQIAVDLNVSYTTITNVWYSHCRALKGARRLLAERRMARLQSSKVALEKQIRKFTKRDTATA